MNEPFLNLITHSSTTLALPVRFKDARLPPYRYLLLLP